MMRVSTLRRIRMRMKVKMRRSNNSMLKRMLISDPYRIKPSCSIGVTLLEKSVLIESTYFRKSMIILYLVCLICLAISFTVQQGPLNLRYHLVKRNSQIKPPRFKSTKFILLKEAILSITAV